MKAGERKLTLTVEEAAARLGIGRNAAYRGVRSGEIPSIKIGNRIVVPKAALNALLSGGGLPNETA